MNSTIKAVLSLLADIVTEYNINYDRSFKEAIDSWHWSGSQLDELSRISESELRNNEELYEVYNEIKDWYEEFNY